MTHAFTAIPSPKRPFQSFSERMRRNDEAESRQVQDEAKALRSEPRPVTYLLAATFDTVILSPFTSPVRLTFCPAYFVRSASF